MTLAVDSFSPHTAQSAAALRAASVPLALRYHYNLTGAEISTLHNNGVAVGLICEFDTPTWHPPLHNPERGADHAKTSVAKANQLGFPRGSVLWLTADSYIPDWSYSSAYWRLAAPIIRGAGYLVGAYGGSMFIDYLKSACLTDLTWQCGAASWNGYVHSKTAALRQWAGQAYYGGIQVDNNDLFDMRGAWLPDGSAHSSDLLEGDDMTPEDHEQIRNMVREEVTRISSVIGSAVVADLGPNARGLNADSIAALKIMLVDLATKLNTQTTVDPVALGQELAKNLNGTDAKAVADEILKSIGELAQRSTAAGASQYVEAGAQPPVTPLEPTHQVGAPQPEPPA